jgi:hypothetical protein
MILLFISIFLFNLIALIKNKIPSIRNVSIWTFTIAFQVVFDMIVEFKYNGYWYFDKGVDWFGILAHTALIPPVNIMLLSWFPFNTNLFKQAIYITCWTVGVIVYEALVLLPEPWGFFPLDGGSCGMMYLLSLFLYLSY